ncbi:MAG: NAD-dependent epimerase/dehydratase family protein [Bacillota bacterium]
MLNILVTGSAGFIGKNLVHALRRNRQYVVWEFDRNSPAERLNERLALADVVFHIAGENRPTDPVAFEAVNVGLTRAIIRALSALGRRPRLIFASSIQAENDSLYGRSKREAEEDLRQFAEATGCQVVAYRLKNIFGKWSRPNYNSVVATFCHNVARGLPITISDPARVLELVYIDDVVAAFMAEIERTASTPFSYADVPVSYRITVAELASRIHGFHQSRRSGWVPDFSDGLTKALYATYLANLDTKDFAYSLETKTDSRGTLAELLKSSPFGQVFVSTTKPGVTRGNHFHDTKAEKFIVLRGEAEVRFRHVSSNEIVRYSVSGANLRVVDIPPGYTHSITNIGDSELIVLFWANEVFDPERPDTYRLEVERE